MNRLLTLAPAFLLVSGVLFSQPLFAADIDAELTVGNVAPVVVSVTPQGLTSPLFPVTPSAGSTVDVDLEVVVEDLNGCNDVSTVQVTIKKPDGSTFSQDTLDSHDSCTVLTTATYTHTHTVAFHHDAGDWDVEIVATDSAVATGNNLADTTSFRVEELVALGLGSSTLTFGAGLDPGETTSASDLSVQNKGNTQIDTQVSGSTLTNGDDTIPFSSITWSLGSDMSSPQTLSGDAVTATAFDLAAGASSTKDLYWQVSVPTALPAGTYQGSLTVAAVKST